MLRSSSRTPRPKDGGSDLGIRFPNGVDISANDLTKRSFQVCAAASDGEVSPNRKFSRPKLERSLGNRSLGLFAMEFCLTAQAGVALRLPRATTYA